MELARGQISDRPWGQTLAAIGFRGTACQLTLFADDGKPYCIAFDREAVIGAYSPLVADSIIRIALTGQLITPGLVPVLSQRLAALGPDEDEVDAVAKVCHLDADQALRLRRRALAQRAARSFAIDHGTFILEDEITVPCRDDAAIDVRAIVLAGLRTFLPEPRLAADLQQLGTHFQLRYSAVEDLTQFGFLPEEKPLIEALRHGATLTDLVRFPGIDARSAHATVYALVACFACDAHVPAATPAYGTVPPMTPMTPPTSPYGTPPQGSEPGFAPFVAPMAQGSEPPQRPSGPRMVAEGTHPPRRTLEHVKADPLLARTAPDTHVTDDPSVSGSRKVADPIVMGEEAFHRGMAYLKDDSQLDRAIEELSTATSMDPSNPDYIGMLAWAHFCKAKDKKTVADRTKKALAHAIHKSQKPELAHFYFGRVERILGHDRNALEHFEIVLESFPKHAEAQAEVRVLRQKIAAGSGEKPGLSGLFGRRK